ncbi:uncharacterized protein LOC114339993 isoform X1 [Diabrotica virgifera virgifera]|uniref:Titin-like n=1 Tax=Diabrotica virgifera virgifera TaxID=50390 RepID=A0ABM5KN48_DIAVI|nr:uncharacterized protein LOC114339993 isoform X1 [Diabrotica virgifera virgifera]
MKTPERMSQARCGLTRECDEHSDSEESNITTSPRLPKTFQQKSYYNKLPYSSQSTPRRKYQHESTKSTRSSSTASENKITFNEDEYTKITTPRQDVLFKKGYLNKPRNYQTQTSTGTSTTSTGNSTGNGTPDHQSTDLEYDSQFVFPNGFVDQNGIYYVNSFEPYPLMLYNPPTYYTEFSNSKSKRYSTGSLTESTSPNNEEATSQDLSGGEASNNVSDYSGNHNVYNMVYPGYYVNGICPPQEIEVREYPTDQTRKIKKRRRRKTSKSQTNNQDSTECSEDEDPEPTQPKPTEKPAIKPVEPEEKQTNTSIEAATANPEPKPDSIESTTEETPKMNHHAEEKPIESEKTDNSEPVIIVNGTPEEVKICTENLKSTKYDLKPDAEEFVPRAFRTPEIPLSPVQFIKVPPNFMPIPVVPFNGQINPAFIPPGGIPINFLPPDPKMFPNFINFVPTPPRSEEATEKNKEAKEVTANHQNTCVIHHCTNIAKSEIPLKAEKIVEKSTPGKTIDIATIVSKLEEAAKEQEEDEDKSKVTEAEQITKKRIFKNNQKYRSNFKRNYYNSPRSSPQRQNGDITICNGIETNENKHIAIDNQIEEKLDPKFIRESPERFRKNWKNYQNNNNKWHQNGTPRSPKYSQRVPVNGELKQNLKQAPETIKTVENPKKTESPNKPPLNSPAKTNQPKIPDQWISVSSRKKRKNKNAETETEDYDFVVEDATPIEEDKDDQFQSYDVNLLVDVVPPSQTEDIPSERLEETLTVEITEGKIEEIISNIAQTESNSIQNNSLVPDIRSVTDIESEIINKEETLPEETQEVTADVVVDNDITLITTVKPETEPIDNVAEDVKTLKKKSKKNSQKSQTKRVIITDIDLSNKCEEPKTPVKKVVKKVDKAKDAPEIKIETVEPIVMKPVPSDETDDKKIKKKKKKTPKTVTDSSLSSSTTTLSVAEDAYDILLDANLSIESDKTNDEISVELDKMIQKGMYSNLEGKMRSLNIAEEDGFFKSVFSKIPISGRTEATGFLKTPDFTKIPLYKADSVSDEQLLESKQTNEQLPASESPDVFLDRPQEKPEEQKSLYPITEAVKEWMVRTRETTPEVEIFKSPMTIYKEFCDNSDTNSDTEVCGNLLSNELSASADDEEEEEVTLFTTEDTKSREGSSEDLLEYWEDLKPEDTHTEEVMDEKVENADEEQGLEVYESKYGKNEDFLNLQKEAREKAKATFPRHGNLPYRAVCCNLM